MNAWIKDENFMISLINKVLSSREILCLQTCVRICPQKVKYCSGIYLHTGSAFIYEALILETGYKMCSLEDDISVNFFLSAFQVGGTNPTL